MTPSARKELEKMKRLLDKEWPSDSLCETSNAYLEGFVGALSMMNRHVTRRLKAAKRSKK